MSLFRIQTVFSGVEGAPFLSTMYFTGDPLGPAGAVTAVDTFWDNLAGVMATGLLWTVNGEVSEINQETGALVDVHNVTPAGGAGSAGGDRTPAATQGLIKWNTGVVVNGRILRGRTFIPCPNEAQGAAAPNATYVLALATAGNNLIASPAGFQIWHRPTTPVAADGSSELVQACTAWNKYAVLRSRRD